MYVCRYIHEYNKDHVYIGVTIGVTSNILVHTKCVCTRHPVCTVLYANIILCHDGVEGWYYTSIDRNGGQVAGGEVRGEGVQATIIRILNCI